MSYATEAAKLVLGDRNEAYGTPKDDYEKTAKIWTAMLADLLKPGANIPAERAILMMAGLKLSRLCYKHKDDSAIDAHGYLLCYEWAVTNKKPE